MLADQPTLNLVSALLVGIPMLLFAVAITVAYVGFRTELRAANVTMVVLTGKFEAVAKDVSSIRDMTTRTDGNVTIVRERSVRLVNPNE